MKKIISIIISVSLLLMSVPAFAISGTGTEANPYLISSASDIVKIHNDLDGYYKLTSNINMSGVAFEPIGNENEGAFTGTIDGNGYTISNLNINLPENKYVGFVGYLEGCIKNLNLADIEANGYRYVGGLVGYAEEGSEISGCTIQGKILGEYTILNLYIGGICGYGYRANIDSCINYGRIENLSNNFDIYMGGIAGYNYQGKINNCMNYSTINAKITSTIGGIVGTSKGEISNCTNRGNIDSIGDNVGGVVGSNEGEIFNCKNIGTITSIDASGCKMGGIAGESDNIIKLCINFGYIAGSQFIGGICAYAHNGNVIDSCVNYGEIFKSSDTGSFLGGVSAYNYGTIKSSLNSATIQGFTRASGIVGYNGGIIDSCFNNGIVLVKSSYASKAAGIVAQESGKTSNCYNSGVISAISSYFGSTAAGISGYFSDGDSSVTSCYNIGYISATGTSAFAHSAESLCYKQPAVNSYTLSEILNQGSRSSSEQHTLETHKISKARLKQAEKYTNLDFDDIWYIDASTNSGFPQLQNMPEHIVLNECVEIMEVGDTDTLYAYIDGISETVTWSCEDESVATISSDGKITAKSIGVTMATATNADGMKANCLIYVYGRASSMELTNDEINIDEGEEYLLKDVQNPNTANEAVVWYSENNAVASVSQNGVVTANAKGTTKVYAITATSEIRAECIVNVSAPITKISLSSTSKTIKVGSSDVITATLSPADYEGGITWSSSDTEIATVDQNGKITANKIGTAYIIATATSGITAQCTVTVNQPVTSIKLNKVNVTTYVGSTYQLSATVLPVDTTDDITWSSYSTSYATVSTDGLITGKREGTTTITAKTSSGLTATCYVTVKAAQVMPTSVTLSDTYITLAPEDAKALIPTFEPSNTTETTLVWTSSDESVATVDKNGVVTAVSNGFATIRGKTTNGLTSECVVKVVSTTGTSVLLDNTKASPGGTAQVKANIVKNPGLSAYKFKVNYDADVLTPVSITPNSEFGGTFSTNLEDTDRTELNVLWYSGNEDVVVNGELFTVNFKVNDSAAYGDSSIVSIEYGANDICDVSGNYIAIYTEDATLSITDPRPGDIYEDSDVNVYDLTLLARYITSLETYTERQEEAADVNNDERVDILDVIRLAQHLVNWSGIELMLLDLYDEPTTPVVSVGSASVNESNEAEIPVYIKNNSGILGYRFVLDYNAEDIEILSITPSELINKDGFNHNLGAESQATDGLVVSCFASGNNITDDGVLFTIKVRYKNPAYTSVSPISVVDSFDNIGNENAAYVTATYETGYALGSDYIVANKVVGDTNFSCELYFDDSYAEQSAKAIIAFYDGDGRMVQIMPKDITIKPGKVDLSIDYDKKAYATYKLMIWEGLNSLKPITEVK